MGGAAVGPAVLRVVGGVVGFAEVLDRDNDIEFGDDRAAGFRAARDSQKLLGLTAFRAVEDHREQSLSVGVTYTV